MSVRASPKTRGTGEEDTATAELTPKALLLCLHVCMIPSSTSSSGFYFVHRVSKVYPSLL